MLDFPNMFLQDMFLQVLANGIMTLGLLQPPTQAETMLGALHLGLHMQIPQEIGCGQKM